VLVSPRYLAGASVDIDAALEPLTSKHGWIEQRVEDGILYISPCHRVRAGFLGEAMHPWQIVAEEYPLAPPEWMASYDGRTPPEIVAAFLETVADNLAAIPERVVEPTYNRTDVALAPLRQAGWTIAVGANETTVTAPNRMAIVTARRRPRAGRGEQFDQYDETWEIEAGPPGERWSGCFSRDTPLPLVAAATRSLLATAPVERHLGDLDPSCLPHLTIHPLRKPDAGRIQAALAASPAATAPLILSAPRPDLPPTAGPGPGGVSRRGRL